MFSAKDETNAMGPPYSSMQHTTHCVLAMDLDCPCFTRSIPNLTDLQHAFPDLPADKLGHDVAYPAMLTFLPTGLLGLVAASLIAAFMSTMSKQLQSGRILPGKRFLSALHQARSISERTCLGWSSVYSVINCPRARSWVDAYGCEPGV